MIMQRNKRKESSHHHGGGFVCLLLSLSLSLCFTTPFVVVVNGYTGQQTTSLPKGTAALPQQKKKIAVVGAGGYTGGLAFGFLQRASSLYGTGIDYNCRVLGATSQTSKYLNGVLGRHFALAQADESFVKLTNFDSPEYICQMLDNASIDAIIFSTDMIAETRPVTYGTYETSPNTKTNEIFWDYRTIQQTTPLDAAKNSVIVENILDNLLQACQLSSTLQHVVVVGSETSQRDVVESRLSSSSSSNKNIPYTFLRYKGDLESFPSYTYRKGVIGNLMLENDTNNSPPPPTELQDKKQIDTSFLFREDLAALTVQCLMSLDWKKSHHISVECDGREAVLNDNNKNQRNVRKLRPDQQWCINAKVLEDKLTKIVPK